MGWRLRRSVKLMPGVRLNFTKSGISTTIGGKGARATFGRGRVTNTVGVPGTGISYSSTTRSPVRPRTPGRSGGAQVGCIAIALAAVCFAKHLPVAGAALAIIGAFFLLPAGLGLMRGFSGATTAQAAADAAARKDLGAALDKVRLLLFVAREDGAVRADERDLIVRYLRSQQGSEDATEVWLKQLHAKLPSESLDAMKDSVERLGSAGRVDDYLIRAIEALAGLSKVASPAQGALLKSLRAACVRVEGKS